MNRSRTSLALLALSVASLFLAACSGTGYKPYIGPYLTLLSPETTDESLTPTVLDPATSMVIHYELEDPPADFRASVRYRKKESGRWTVQTEDDVAPLETGWGKVHHVTLKGLDPDSRYQYRVVGPGGVLGKVYEFKTAPSEMNYSRFLAVGDMQDEQADQRWQELADAIVVDHLDEFDFIITVGDMVKDDVAAEDDRFHWWKVFFDKGQELLASKPIFPAIGNHDTPGNGQVDKWEDWWSNPEDTRSFRKYFYLKPDMAYADYYGFRYGNAHFLAINSEIPAFYGRYPERDRLNKREKLEKWLRNEVQTAQEATWSFSYCHVPHINPAGGKDEVQYLRPYVEYFNRKVDWSITGHVHEYQRLKPVQATADTLDFRSAYGRRGDEGVGYLVTPPAGQWPRNNSSEDMHQLAFHPHNENGVAYEIGFTIVRAEAESIEIRTYGMGAVGSQVQPEGYRPGNDRSKRLLDVVRYTRQR